MRPVNRIVPKLPVKAMLTYQVSTPLSSHFRPATCQEVRCLYYAFGWQTLVDESTELGQKQAHYIRHLSERHYTEARNEVGLTIFMFPAGQTCFRPHHASLEREEIFSRFHGDYRGQIGQITRLRPGDWVDDFAEHQERLAHAIEMG